MFPILGPEKKIDLDMNTRHYQNNYIHDMVWVYHLKQLISGFTARGEGGGFTNNQYEFLKYG